MAALEPPSVSTALRRTKALKVVNHGVTKIRRCDPHFSGVVFTGKVGSLEAGGERTGH